MAASFFTSLLNYLLSGHSIPQSVYLAYMSELIRLILLDLVLALVFWRLLRQRWTLGTRSVLFGLCGVFGVLFANVALDAIRLWSNYAKDPIQQFFLPPHSTVILEHIWRLGQPVLVAGIFAAAFFSLLAFAKRRWKLEQYSETDLALLTIAVLVSGWPGFFVTLVALFLVALVANLALALRNPKQLSQARLVITPYILPVAAVLLWFLPKLIHVTSLEKIRF